MSRFVKSCVILVVSADALQIARKKKEINKGSSWFSNNVISRGFTAMKNGANVAITTSGITVGLQALKFNRCREINQDLVKDACSGEAKDPDSRVTDHMIQTSLDYYKKDMDEVVKRAHNKDPDAAEKADQLSKNLKRYAVQQACCPSACC